MRTRRTIPAKPLVGVGLALCILAVGLWAVPTFGGASEDEEDESFSVFVNIPVNEIQDGQFCQGYVNVTGGTPPEREIGTRGADHGDIPHSAPFSSPSGRGSSLPTESDL